MANAQQYEVYLANTIALAKTMIVKHAGVADAINTALTTGSPAYDVNDADPTSWKYYLNLAGQYHESDTLMQVISQDTLQTIDFTVANLAVNTATAVAYAPGGRYYTQLVAQYPTQELLIRGILHPTPMATAINAADGTVLWFDPSLVESNEMSLMLDIQNWMQLFLRRWYVAAYSNTDDLYLATMLGVMFSTLPSVILGLRLKYCHTYQAHSFHITQFLASHGKLDAYVASLTKPQMLWLYRNIRYIQRNAGQTGTFQNLIQNVMTARNLPLSTWNMQHDISQIQTTLAPSVIFEREALNFVTSEEGVETRDVQAMLAYELNAAPANDDSQTHQDEVTEQMAWGQFSELTTKVLESSVLDSTDASPYRLSDCLLNHWLYYASLGMYRAVISVPDPTTGDTYTFSMSDAFVVYMYAFGMSNGLLTGTEVIPTVYANKVLKRPLPTTTEIANLVDMSVLTAADLQAVFTNAPSIPNQFLSITAFNATVRAIHNYELYQHALFSTQGHLWTRAYLETATLYCYRDYEVVLAPEGTTFISWFQTRGLDVPSLSTEQLSALSTAIVTAATGADLYVVESLADIQKAMLAIMTQLSSYSVQYLQQINDSPLIVLERPSIRLGDTEASASSLDKVTIPQAQLLDFDAGGACEFDGVMPADVSAYDWRATGGGLAHMGIEINVLLDVKTVAKSRIPMVAVHVVRVNDGLEYDLSHAVVTESSQYHPAGLQPISQAFTDLTLDFYTVTSDDTSAMEAKYNAYIAANGLPVGLLSDVIQVTTLPPFWTPPSP